MDGTPKNCFQCAKLGSTLRCSNCKVAHYCDAVCQRNHWKTHKKICKGEKKYEIAIIEGKGKGMMAKCNIAKGELIIEEKMIVKIAKLQLIVSGLGILGIQKINNLPEKEKKQFYELNDPNPEGNETMKPLRIYENNCLPDGIFPTISRINHSCKPNALWSTDDEVTQEVRAIRDIAAGEEITCSYLRQSTLRTFQERKEGLKNWNFECSCEVCSLKGKELEDNDEMRLKMRINHEKIESFLDRCQANPRGIMKMPSQLKDAFNRAVENQNAVESLGVECGAFSVHIYNQLFLLSMMARKVKCKLENAENPQVFKEKARQLGKQFGKMFESIVATNEKSVDSLNYL